MRRPRPWLWTVRMAARYLMRWAMRRDPDFIVGGGPRPYLQRWYVLPRNRLLNIYLHRFLRSDDDRALHDHPWVNLSILLSGSYVEHTIAAGGIHCRRLRPAGALKLRGARSAHRIEIADPCITLFITGPVLRDWGFHCPETGWRHWRDFVDPEHGGAGRGCD